MTVRRESAYSCAARIAACAIFLIAAGWAIQAGAQQVSVPGTKVSLDPPDGFAPSDRFPGFQSRDIGASIMVTEIPGPISKVRSGMTRRGLATRGMTLLSSETKTVDGRQALVLSVNQSARGTLFRKWLLVFGDEAASVVVVGTFPESVAASAGSEIQQAVLSTRWNRDKAVDHFEGLPFRITASGSLKIANRISSVLMLTEGGTKRPASAEEPLLVIAASVDDREIGDLEAFSRRRLNQIRQVTDLKELSGRSRTVDGLPAYELIATASDRRTGATLRVYQLMISDGKGYFLAQGLVGISRGDALLPEFRQVSESLKRAP